MMMLGNMGGKVSERTVHTCERNVLDNFKQHRSQALVEEPDLLRSLVLIMTLLASLCTIVADMCIVTIFSMNKAHVVLKKIKDNKD